MVSVYTINGEVTLDITPFKTAISEVTTELNKLGKGLEIDKQTLRGAEQTFGALKDIIHQVSLEAKEINQAFSNIKGIKSLLENLQLVQEYLVKIKGESINISNIESKRATLLGQVGKEIIRQGNEIKKNLTYEEEMIATENLFKNGLAEEMSLYAEKVQLQEQIRAINESDMAIRNGIATNVKDILAMTDEELMLLREELALEEQILGVEKQQTSEQKRQNSARTQGNDLDKMGYLPRRIGSMALTMWGFNEIMDIYETTSANLNARGSMKYFGNQLMTNERYLTQTNQTLGQVRRSLNDYGDDLDRLQKKYQKIDMTVIGANAEETAYKYGVQADKLGDLSEVYAVYGSEFVKQGRTQEDSVLAINDALDGEVRRLKEVNIKMEDLKEHGYKEGDTASLIDALNEIAKERGYDITAQNITNLSDAITVLELKISQGLASAFEYIEPLLREVTMDFIYMIDALTWLFGTVNKHWNDFMTEMDKMFGVQKVQAFSSGLIKGLGVLVTAVITFGIVYKVVKSLKGALSSLFGVLGKGKDIGGEVAKDTGGIAKTGSDVGFKQGFKNEFSKLGKNLGKMGRIFIEFAVALAMAWLLIREAMFIISDIGAEYERIKPQFQQGAEFLKEYGLSMALIGGAFVVLGFIVDKIPKSVITSTAKGMAILMGLIAEAIGLLILPLISLTAVGGLYNWQQSNIESGMKVIRMVADALHIIEQDDTIGWFIVGFVGLSAVLGMTADLVAIPLAVGIATSLLLVAEAIGLLVVPLGAIALLGATASALGEENINQGAEAIRMIGRVLKVLSDAMVDLFVVDIATLGVMLTEKATQLITGKTGLEALTDDIIPSLTDFIKDFNGLDMGEPVDQAKVQSIIQMSNDIPPLFNAIQKLNNALGTNNVLRNIGGAIGGGISGMIGMGLKSKLDQLYNDAKDVMDFATKMGSLSGGGKSGNANAITQTANAIVQLRNKLNQMISTVSGASGRLQSASNQLGKAITTGFQSGSSGFTQAVVSVLAKGVSEIQSRYATFQSGGRTLATKMTDGFKNHNPKLKTIVSTEIGYALRELDSRKSDFYNKGQALGEALSDGFKSKGGLWVGSPAKIARTIAQEMEYSMLAIDTGKQMLYRGGQALGSALATGYAESSANLRTNVDVLASKGVSNEQLQANARSVQANDNLKGKAPKLTQNNINIDMSGATIIGIQDLDARIRESVQKAIVQINSPNGAIGY